LPKIKAWIDAADGGLLIPFSAVLDAKLLQMEAENDPSVPEAYLKEKGITSAIPKIIKNGFSGLNLIYFFTAGEDEVRCWNIRQGTLAPQAAGVVHSDMEKGFICAEVMKYDDFKELGSENALKAAGKYKQKGRDYVVADGDILLFKFNAPTAAKKK